MSSDDPFSSAGFQEDQALKMLLRLYDGKDKNRLKMITDLSEVAISEFAQALFLHNFLKSKWKIDLKLDKWLLEPLMMLYVSKGRQGRLEATDVLKAQREDDKNKNKTIFERLGMT